LSYKNVNGFLLPQCVACSIGFTPYSNYCIQNNCEPLSYNLTSGKCQKCKNFGYVLTP